jgi:hypothetical protein
MGWIRKQEERAMTEEEMNLFSTAQIEAGYLPPERNPRGDGWLYERDHDRFVGWQFGRIQERERCAKVVEAEDVAPTDDAVGVQQCIAASIRRA